MDPGELFSMLTARSPSTSRTVPGFGSVTGEQVRGALQHLKPAPMAAAMYFRCAEYDALNRVYFHLNRAIAGLSKRESWRADRIITHYIIKFPPHDPRPEDPQYLKRISGGAIEKVEVQSWAQRFIKSHDAMAYMKSSIVLKDCIVQPSFSGRIDTALSRLVLLEYAGGKKCYGCAGEGYRIEDANGHQCEVCEGRGTIRLEGKDKAFYCGMTPENWSRFWQKRYVACYAILNTWVTDADRHLRKNLNDRSVAA